MNPVAEIESLLARCIDAHKQRDPSELERLARAALALLPSLPEDDPQRAQLEEEARYRLGHALTELYRNDEAESLLDFTLPDGVVSRRPILPGLRLHALGRIYERTARPERAIAAYRSAIAIARECDEARLEAWGHNGIGRTSAELNRFADALAAYNAAIEIARRLGDRELEGGVLTNLALLHQSLGDYGQALEYYLAVRTIFEEVAPQSLGGILINIGIIYERLGDPRREIEYALKGLELCERSGRDAWAANALVNIGGAYLSLGELDEARDYLERGLAAQHRIGDVEHAGNAENMLGKLDVKLGDAIGARRHFDAALALYSSCGARKGIVAAHLETGFLIMSEGALDEARAHLRKGLAIADEDDLRIERIEAHHKLFTLEKQAGNTAAALHHLEEHYRLKEALNTEEAKEKITKMQVLHDVESARKEAEIERLRNVELARALEELKHAQTQLVHSEKMASLGQLTAGLAHEINNPVNFIRASTSPLRRDLDEVRAVITRALSDEPAEVRERVERRMQELEVDELRAEIDSLMRGIEEGASRTAEIVKGLRTFSRLDEDHLKEVDLHEGIDSTLTLLRPRLGTITVVRDYGDIPLVECNPGQINQVVMNLLTNAVQAIDAHSHGAGTVTITTRATDDAVTIAVADTGGGIPDDVRARIFEPFFTTKAIGAGTGLGLSISYGIIEQHGGTIDVASAPGEGTTFTVTLPR
jgi:two-component system, NtrC family, sensor kinase